jgi:carboxymethylenebutenolidase
MMAVKVPTISSALLWRTAHCSRSRTNNNTATAALRSLDSRVNEGWPAYEAILRKNIENTAFIYPQSWFS